MQEDKGTVLLSQNEDGNTAQNPGIFCMPNRELAFPELQLKTFPAGQEAIPLAPHFSTTQRPPCVKGAVILPCKMTGGLSILSCNPSVFAFGEASRLRATPAVALTVHRTVIHYRDCASLTPQGELAAAAGLGPSRTPVPTNSIGVWCEDRRRRCCFAGQNNREGQAPPLRCFF